jgi:hypothetical protein
LTELFRLLPALLRKAGDSEEARQQAVFAAWAAAVGSALRKVTVPMRLERKALIVAVPDKTWRTELQKLSGQALFRLNSILGTPAVTTIEFVINSEAVIKQSVHPSPVRFIAPDQQAKPLRDKARRINNPEVRAAFLRAAGKCLDRRAQ